MDKNTNSPSNESNNNLLNSAKISQKPPQIEEKRKGVWKNLLSGGISASIARTLTNPIERLEIFFFCSYRLIINM